MYRLIILLSLSIVGGVLAVRQRGVITRISKSKVKHWPPLVAAIPEYDTYSFVDS